MSIAAARLRSRRIAQLRRMQTLSPAQHDELRRLEANETQMWRDLPRRIERRRFDLAQLIAYADEIGLGPC